MDNRLEDEFLILCAKNNLNEDDIVQIRSISHEDLDWSYVLQSSLKHGVMPLLYKSLSTACPDSVPPQIMERLRNFYIANIRHNYFLTKEMFRLIDLFESYNILAVPYKGAVLASTAYGDIALRQFVDLDIMIQERDVPKAKSLLISSGYHPALQLTAMQEGFFYKFQRDLKFFRNDNKVIVEIQWGIEQKNSPAEAINQRLWERLQSVSVEGRNINAFSLEIMILILCIHGFYHYWERLQWICDLAEFIHASKDKIDWELTLRQAWDCNCERILFVGLLLVSNLLNAPIPDDILQTAKEDRNIRRAVRRLREGLFLESDSPRKAVENFLLHLKMWRGLTAKLRYFIGAALNPNAADLYEINLPANLSFLYFFIRPIRLLKTYILPSMKR